MTTTAPVALRWHWALFITMIAVLLISALTARQVFERRDQQQSFIGIAEKQIRLLSDLQSQLAIAHDNTGNGTTVPAIRNTISKITALEAENLNSADQLIKHNKIIDAIYHQPPYALGSKFKEIKLALDTVFNTATVEQLQQSADQNFIQGINQAVSEVEKQISRDKKRLLPAILLTTGSLLLLMFTYHRVVFRKLLARHNRSAAETQQTKEKLDELALTDTLTGTGNRKAITSFLSNFQSNHVSDSEFVSLAILDIDHFQQINDVFGYFAGDAVLQEVARRINEELRSEDQLGRMNADHFAIVLCGLIAPKAAETIIHRIQEAITRPITFRDTTINITCSVGAAVQENNSLDLAELFKLSEQALLQAKQNRRGSIFLFSENAQLALSRQREIINVIKESRFNDIFELAYQPIVALDSGKIMGCECLLRWIAETPVNLQTTELVPTLEMYGDIHTVGNWVLRQSFQQLKKWQSQPPATSLFMSINVSATQLEATDFAESIVALAEEFELTPGDISLELTETVAIKHLEAGRRQLALLRNLGFGLSLDDFGTGYSSLQYLKNMPASTIKIDQAFVRDMTNDARDAAIVDSAINIAQAIGLNVVAEGIDSASQAQRLRELGCHYGQGYYFFKPLTGNAFEQAVLAQQ